MKAEKIGFIGVGHMGHGMAKNLVEKGWALSVMGHRNRAPVEDLVGRGAREVKTPREMAETCDVVVLCVTGSPQVDAILTGPDGLMAAGRALTVIDCSTSEPAETVRLAADAAQKGITLIDAPLGRTPKEAWEGTLDIMVGGSDADVARVRPILEAMAARVVHMGPTGAGHTTKLLNNFLSLGYAAIYAEAFTLAKKAGVTPKALDQILRGGRMDCGFYQTYTKWVIDRDPNAHKFAISNGLKDLTYLAGFANAMGVANPVGSAARNSFAYAVGTGNAEKYVPMLADVIAGLNGVSLVDP
ncbi:MAG: NAD(P)-dependent oxidoreductase [Labrys sp. (in: a-proteobacteria)]|jgi:3-hydroxyisobutyrate dehydrogenase-like beta-hydroxyacid dehydrogenase